MTNPSISEIQNYLLQQHYDDPIPLKSQERVTKDMAIEIKKINPLKKGRCNLCAREEDRLVPIPMKVCVACANRFMIRGGGLNVIKKETVDYHCDHCLTRAFILFYVNPNVCSICTRLIGRTHKNEHKDMMAERKRIEDHKQKIGMKVQGGK